MWFEFVSVDCWSLLMCMLVPMSDMAGTRRMERRDGRRRKVSMAVNVRGKRDDEAASDRPWTDISRRIRDVA